MTMSANPTLQRLPISLCKPNPWNRSNVEDSIEELAESISTHGQIHPGVVRPYRNNGYQIITGERRWRASQSVGFDSWLVEVREMDDEEARALCITENAQREGAPIIDEAKQVEALMKKNGGNVKEVAVLLGKPEQWVEERMAYLQLPESIQEEINDGSVRPEHAKLLLRANPDERSRVLKILKEDPSADYSIKSAIATNDLDNAIWGLDDASVVRSAPACIGCPSNTSTGSLFADLGPGQCTNGVCFQRKHLETLKKTVKSDPEISHGLIPGGYDWDRQRRARDLIGKLKIPAIDNSSWDGAKFKIATKKQRESGKAKKVINPLSGKVSYMAPVTARKKKPAGNGTAAKESDHAKKQREKRKVYDRYTASCKAALIEILRAPAAPDGPTVPVTAVPYVVGLLVRAMDYHDKDLIDGAGVLEKKLGGIHDDGPMSELLLSVHDEKPGLLYSIVCLVASGLQEPPSYWADISEIKKHWSNVSKFAGEIGVEVKLIPAEVPKKTSKKKAAKKAPPSEENESTGPADGPSFMKPVTPDEALAAIVGGKPITRTELTKKLWKYIKDNDLQDAQNRRMIKADEKLRPVFGGKSAVSMFEMTQHINKHVSGGSNGGEKAEATAEDHPEVEE